MPVSDDFAPPLVLRNGHVQSVLVGMRVRWPFIRRRAARLLDAERFVILDCGDAVRLSGYYSAAGDDGPLAILIHGWEGSAYAQYMVSAGALLFDQGYRVLRMQMRDHGDSHHLNHELFHSCRLAEAVNAVAEIARRFGNGQPVFLGGHSLGGNFALRIGVEAPRRDIELRAIAAVCPVADPAMTLRAMETSSPIYERYFMRRWRRSLRRKRDLFPDAYDDDQLFEHDTMRDLTGYLVSRYGYPSLEAYFDGYRITEERLDQLAIPSLILAADDDPIIPPDDFDRVAKPSCLRIVRTRYGGHCGYIDSIVSPSYADQACHAWFDHHMAPA